MGSRGKDEPSEWPDTVTNPQATTPQLPEGCSALSRVPHAQALTPPLHHGLPLPLAGVLRRVRRHGRRVIPEVPGVPLIERLVVITVFVGCNHLTPLLQAPLGILCGLRALLLLAPRPPRKPPLCVHGLIGLLALAALRLRGPLPLLAPTRRAPGAHRLVHRLFGDVAPAHQGLALGDGRHLLAHLLGRELCLAHLLNEALRRHLGRLGVLVGILMNGRSGQNLSLAVLLRGVEDIRPSRTCTRLRHHC
mmetsp:Transcript_40055/g.95673  ORF Transcript_40055/g.95673 Transcript_40055/m.95673 type:complete len:249 (+) Transcript_40055:166-912(+)